MDTTPSTRMSDVRTQVGIVLQVFNLRTVLEKWVNWKVHQSTGVPVDQQRLFYEGLQHCAAALKWL